MIRAVCENVTKGRAGLKWIAKLRKYRRHRRTPRRDHILGEVWEAQHRSRRKDRKRGKASVKTHEGGNGEPLA